MAEGEANSRTAILHGVYLVHLCLRRGCPLPCSPASQDMISLDPTLAQPFEALKEAVQHRDAFTGLLEIEGMPSDTPAEEYIAHMVGKAYGTHYAGYT